MLYDIQQFKAQTVHGFSEFYHPRLIVHLKKMKSVRYWTFRSVKGGTQSGEIGGLLIPRNSRLSQNRSPAIIIIVEVVCFLAKYGGISSYINLSREIRLTPFKQI